MNSKNLVRAVAEAVVWYAFIVYLLYSLTNPVNIYISGLVLLVLMYLGVWICPWVRHTTAWRRMMGKEQ
ncbi:MAG: hypothetical protein Q7S86_01050 [bacterium]|nr:hypothetical protein [bacterium]